MTFLVKMHVTDAHFTHFAGSTKLPKVGHWLQTD